MSWINVKDRLPETNIRSQGYIYESDPVLVWTSKGYEVSKFTKRYKPGKNGALEFDRNVWFSENEVTHWSILPPKPE